MNALDMLGGFTASAGPIGGAGTSGAGAGEIGADGFDALVTKALVLDRDREAVLPGGSDEDLDSAEPGLDLSVMLALAGLAPFQVTPQATAPVATAAGDPVTLGTLPCTLVPGGDVIEPSQIVEAGPVSGKADVEPAAAQDPVPSIELKETLVAASPTKGEAAVQPKDIGLQDAAASSVLATDAPSGLPAPMESPKDEAAPGAGAAHPALRARMARAARGEGDQGLQMDAARRLATGELRDALSASVGNQTAAVGHAGAENGVQTPATGGARVNDGAPAARTPDATRPADVTMTIVGGVALSTDSGPQSGGFGSRRESGSGEPRVTPVVGLTGARAEAAIQTFSTLSAEPAALNAAARELAPAQAAEAMAVTPQDTAHNVQSMVRAMRLHFTDGGGEARLLLNPEHLGQVTLTVKVEQGRVAAHIQAETSDASRWIETHQSNLRSALEDQGLDVQELVVTTNPDGRREREQPQQQPKARQPRRTADGQTPKFEILA